jgi:hypothetical protein
MFETTNQIYNISQPCHFAKPFGRLFPGMMHSRCPVDCRQFTNREANRSYTDVNASFNYTQLQLEFIITLNAI